MKIIGRNVNLPTVERHTSARGGQWVRLNLAYGYDFLLRADEAFELANQLVDAAEAAPPIKGTIPNPTNKENF